MFEEKSAEVAEHTTAPRHGSHLIIRIGGPGGDR